MRALNKPNVKRVHPYQRGRTSITGFGLNLRKIIETERLVGVARRVLLAFGFHYLPGTFPKILDLSRPPQ